MMERDRSRWKRYGIAAACGVLALAVIAGAYWMGRSAGPGGDVGEEAAKSAALSHAGIAESQLSSYRIARDEEGGAQVYEVEFTADGVAYDYVVSAATGSIVKFSRDAEETVPPPEGKTPAPEGGDVGEARAWEIAYAHAGVTAEAAAALPAERDYENGVLVYELKFSSGGYAYDYEISAADGSVVKFEKEADAGSAPSQTPSESSGAAPAAPVETPAGNTPGTPAKTPAAGDIGEARAKEIALAHAGVTADSVTGYRWELDYEDGVQVYELEFFSGGYEYDYEISAADGSVVKFKKEVDGTRPVQSSGNAAPAYIGEARAKEIAFGHAGLAADAVVRCAVELDHHDGHAGNHGAGCCEYEIDFKSGGYEYEYTVDAVTGEILEFKQELDG